MKKIIYATDFSENSVAALQYAAEFSKLMGDDLIVLHVYRPQDSTKFNSDFLKMHQEELMNFCRLHLKENFDPNRVSPAVLTGQDIAEEIQKFSKDLPVRIIIMGACGASKLKDRLLGTTTSEMIGKSLLPVLAVPPQFSFRRPQKIYFASTFDEQELSYLKELTAMTASLDAQIEVIHVSHREQHEASENLKSFQKKVEQEISYSRIGYKTIYSSDVFDSLKKAIENDRPDLVVMSDKKNPNFFKRGLVRDRIKRMQSCSPSPLLSFPASA